MHESRDPNLAPLVTAAYLLEWLRDLSGDRSMPGGVHRSAITIARAMAWGIAHDVPTIHVQALQSRGWLSASGEPLIRALRSAG